MHSSLLNILVQVRLFFAQGILRKFRGDGRDPGIRAPAFIKPASNSGSVFRATKHHIACVNKMEKASSRPNHTDEMLVKSSKGSILRKTMETE
jgi:hypothetical protein